MMRCPFGVGILAALIASGCGSRSIPTTASGSNPSPVRIAAASDLQSALPEIARAFSSQTGVELSLTFGASGQLAEQIKAGAPFDVFLAANRSFVEELADRGFVRPDSVASYARGTLVLAVHEASAGSVARLADLTRPEIKKIALANPETAPYGKAGKQALERSGLWNAVAPRIVQSESVRQALVFVREGNAEAGMVGRAIADVPEIRIVQVDPALYDPIVQALGVVSTTRSEKQARAFARFVLGVEGQAVLARFGFAKPEASPPAAGSESTRTPDPSTNPGF